MSLVHVLFSLLSRARLPTAITTAIAVAHLMSSAFDLTPRATTNGDTASQIGSGYMPGMYPDAWIRFGRLDQIPPDHVAVFENKLKVPMTQITQPAGSSRISALF